MGTSPRYTGIYIMKFTVVGRGRRRRRRTRRRRRGGDCRVNRSRGGESKICGRNIARIPVNRVEAAFVNFTYCRGGGGRGDSLHLAGRRIRVSASRLRWNKDANYCLARAPGNDPLTPPSPPPPLPSRNRTGEGSRKGVYFSGCGTRWDECAAILSLRSWDVGEGDGGIRFWTRIIIFERK